jgi:hypothetical protein
VAAFELPLPSDLLTSLQGVTPRYLFDRPQPGTARSLGPVCSWARCVAVVGKLIGQPDAATGALATLRAATDPAAKGADYYAPDGRVLNGSGHPVPVRSSSASHDLDTQRRLWVESERLTGVTYSFTSRSDTSTAA